MKLFAAVLSVVLTITVPTLVLAKGETVKVTIQSPTLAAPIEITDPAIQQFNVWSGPGTFLNGVEGRHGFIIDWVKGVADAPVGLHHYKVSFYIGCESNEPSACRTTEPSLAYVVFYDYDASAGQGFVYLPGRDEEFFRLNVGAIYRGPAYNGHWFRATKAWDDFVAPFIARVTAAR